MDSMKETSGSDRRWVTTLISVAVHVVALWFISTGPAGGVPWGSPAGTGRIYSLSYLGEFAASGPGSGPEGARATESGQGAPQQALRRLTSAALPAKAPAPETPRQAPPGKAGAAGQGQLLASPHGGFAVPVAAKPVERPEPEQSGVQPEGGLAGSLAGGAGLPGPTGPGAGSGGQNGLPGPPPPRGAGMVASLPKLVYPKGAQNAGAKGTVRLRVDVNREGRPTRVEVEHSSGDRRLDEYARRAVERGLATNPWVSPYVVRVEARFEGGVPEVRVLDEPVEIGG